MKQNDIDLVIKSALGEADAAESIQVQALLARDPKAAREAELWAQLKNDFRVLAEVPDHQLSSERLRSAVLGGTIRKKAVSPFRFWLPAAGMAAVAAIAYLALPKTPQQSQPTVNPIAITDIEEASPTSDNLSLNGGVPDLPDPLTTKKPAAKAGAGVAGSAAGKVSSSTRRRTGWGHTRPVAMNTAAKDSADQALDMALAAVNIPVEPAIGRGSPGGGGAPSAMMAPAPSGPSSSDDDGVVVIKREASPTTGAPVAVEVGRSHDVVFGG